MMLHTAQSFAADTYREPDLLISSLPKLLKMLHLSLPRAAAATVPIVLVGFERDRVDHRVALRQLEGVEYEIVNSRIFGWGRVRLEHLLAYWLEELNQPPATDLHYFYSGLKVDLATTVSTTPARHVGVSSGPALSAVETALKSMPSSAGAASASIFLDIGVRQPPTNFGGRLSFVDPHLDLSQHSMLVLSAFLERIRRNSPSATTRVFMALVDELIRPIGLSCFQHVSTVEVLAVLKAAFAAVVPSSFVLTNVSLGTHVGPHDGSSPFEQYLTQRTYLGETLFCCASGNDGARGVFGSAELTADVPEYLTLRTGPDGARELLVEIWVTRGDDIEVDVDVVDPLGARPFSGASSLVSTRTAGRWLGIQASPIAPPPKRPPSQGRVMQSLICDHDGGAKCVAFALSGPDAKSLASLEISIAITSKHNATVSAWVVVSEDPAIGFVGGGQGGKLVVPSTAHGALCVAGTVAPRRPWVHSSFGPPHGTNNYHHNSHSDYRKPHVAYNVDVLTESGTSFAAPRATADALRLLHEKEQALAPLLLTPDMFLDSVLGFNRKWVNARLGYGDVSP